MIRSKHPRQDRHCEDIHRQPKCSLAISSPKFQVPSSKKAAARQAPNYDCENPQLEKSISQTLVRGPKAGRSCPRPKHFEVDRLSAICGSFDMQRDIRLFGK